MVYRVNSLTPQGSQNNRFGMRFFRRHGRGIGWLGIVALLSNVLMPVLSYAQARAAATDSIFGSIVICTAHGAETTSDQGGGPSPLEGDHCPLCDLQAAYAFWVPPALAASAFPEPAADRWLAPAEVRTAADHLSLGGIHNRGPPQSA
jgi:hypothetical protein